ncbi:MAG: hypothetical protein ACOX47_09520 [Bacillota bacterium]
MQKRVNKIIIGYILFICIVGAGLLIKRQIDSIPVVDDALIQEIIDSTEFSDVESDGMISSSQNIVENNEEKEQPESNYWENYYRETETKKEKDKGEKNPVVSQIQKKISTGDKLRIMKIIKKNLSSEEIKYILSLVKDGFTNKEQIEVKSILGEKIGEKEKQELKEILLKYL